MVKHFEELWEECEKFHQSEGSVPPKNIVEELALKVNLYKLIAEKTEIPVEDLNGLKVRALGEILLTLTNLSLAENINTFEALNNSLQQRAFSKMEKKLV